MVLVIEPGPSRMHALVGQVIYAPNPFKDKFSLHYSLTHGHFSVFWGMSSLFHSVIQGNLELLGSLGYCKPYSTAFQWTQPHLVDLDYISH